MTAHEYHMATTTVRRGSLLTRPLWKAVQALVLSMLMVALPAWADDTVSPAPAYAMPDTETWDIPAKSGEVYRIFVSRPKGTPPAEGYPVLYVLDGNAMFAGFAEARRIQEGSDAKVSQSIIVGVGYPAEKPYDPRRLYDFTPPFPNPVPQAQSALAKMRAGGRDYFAEFLIDTLRPEIARRYSANPDRQALYGHSLGGLFALHMLYSRPNAFSAIIAASPSQWWNDQSILIEERAFVERLVKAKPMVPPAKLLLLVGELEDRVANVWDAEALAERIRPLTAYGFRNRFQKLEGETHITVPSRSVTQALRFAFIYP